MDISAFDVGLLRNWQHTTRKAQSLIASKTWKRCARNVTMPNMVIVKPNTQWRAG
jgi:hypothetical protein